MLAGLLLAGCTEKDPGQAVQASSSSDAPAASGGGQPPPSIPPRPKNLPLNSVDPCKLFAKAQLDQIKVNRQRNLVETSEAFKGAPYCAMDGQDGKGFFSYNVSLITTEGIAPWLSGKRNVDAKLVSVGGFPAADYKLLGTTTFNCNTSVDVADGQQLMVEFQPDTRNAYTQDQMCQRSEQAAGFALQTLQTLK
ncbi:DUF3558 domain-containing protein [Actinocrispum wychmicini]|uniref:DUF3558 domain-containing protein n=1 Tax=Actinocrispum wychmicini TaxID=1213861 RepID=UPI001FB60E8A|nr:DUF3558 domain-containing protein [Actinocrispum wychmicini]